MGRCWRTCPRRLPSNIAAASPEASNHQARLEHRALRFVRKAGIHLFAKNVAKPITCHTHVDSEFAHDAVVPRPFAPEERKASATPNSRRLDAFCGTTRAPPFRTRQESLYVNHLTGRIRRRSAAGPETFASG